MKPLIAIRYELEDILTLRTMEHQWLKFDKHSQHLTFSTAITGPNRRLKKESVLDVLPTFGRVAQMMWLIGCLDAFTMEGL